MCAVTHINKIVPLSHSRRHRAIALFHTILSPFILCLKLDLTLDLCTLCVYVCFSNFYFVLSLFASSMHKTHQNCNDNLHLNTSFAHKNERITEKIEYFQSELECAKKSRNIADIFITYVCACIALHSFRLFFYI